ncbi:hypothetical protein SUGI_1035780 [Cryptomeria japonica]|uniref:auxin-responsive protein SAUR36 n=1 Tax=Cryptomeria japonica TaxID=3369 RepID=UPI002414A87D|nr:auxin-responsive protein SAUR36 [Cryptomeria japonica]GLJ49098.1 hypothetical protein SUGI_1035780 [Cryptomeria japonica]
MGFRLGYRIVKIWRWIKLSGKSKSYAPLRLKSGKSVGLRIGGKLCRRWVNSQELLKSSDFIECSQDAQIRQIRLPQLESQWLNSLRWQSYLPHFIQGYKRGLDLMEPKCSKQQVPKGYLAVEVGQGAEHERYVIPVVYCNHPLFRELLKGAEEEYGFNHRGPITIPCKLDHFHSVQKLIQTHQARSY